MRVTVLYTGDAFRGATWVSLHNGGGVGWGEVINGGFGLVSRKYFRPTNQQRYDEWIEGSKSAIT